MEGVGDLVDAIAHDRSGDLRTVASDEAARDVVGEVDARGDGHGAIRVGALAGHRRAMEDAAGRAVLGLDLHREAGARPLQDDVGALDLDGEVSGEREAAVVGDLAREHDRPPPAARRAGPLPRYEARPALTARVVTEPGNPPVGSAI
jgi:hypothetical protein